jgi:hypothetical protein
MVAFHVSLETVGSCKFMVFEHARFNFTAKVVALFTRILIMIMLTKASASAILASCSAPVVLTDATAPAPIRAQGLLFTVLAEAITSATRFFTRLLLPSMKTKSLSSTVSTEILLSTVLTNLAPTTFFAVGLGFVVLAYSSTAAAQLFAVGLQTPVLTDAAPSTLLANIPSLTVLAEPFAATDKFWTVSLVLAMLAHACSTVSAFLLSSPMLTQPTTIAIYAMIFTFVV